MSSDVAGPLLAGLRRLVTAVQAQSVMLSLDGRSLLPGAVTDDDVSSDVACTITTVTVCYSQRD